MSELADFFISHHRASIRFACSDSVKADADIAGQAAKVLPMPKERYMRQRILTILNILKAKGQEGLTGSILDFKAEEEDGFELQINLPQHKTFLRYEASSAEYFGLS